MVNHETNDTSIRPFQFYCHLLILQLMNGSLIKEIINQKKTKFIVYNNFYHQKQNKRSVFLFF